MKNNIYHTLIEHVAKRNWADAQDVFNSIINQKVAVKLDEEKQLLVEPEDEDEKKDEVKEASKPPFKQRADTSDPFEYECGNCDKLFKSQSMDPKCPRCGKKDYVAPREGIGSYRKY